MRQIRSLLWSWSDHFSQILLALILIIMAALLDQASPFFMTWDNWRNILDQSALLVIISVGMTYVICTGGIDLSVGAITALSGVCMAISLQAGLNTGESILIGLAAGAAIGLFNGLLISKLNLSPFIVTLATMSITRGIALILTKGIPIYGFPKDFTWWGSGHIGPVNPPILTALFLALLGALVLNRTKLGYYALSLGGNEEALRRSGVAHKTYKTIIYIISGVAAAIGGLVVTARLNTAEPLAGWMFELDAIAAVVLGGTDMKGGRGSITGTVMACLLLGMLRNGLTILNIPSYYQQLTIGVIILVAIIISELRLRNASHKNMLGGLK
ncbi:MAG: ABC transporter permease [Syntrophomonas sp.]|nr:ABC transporter permease [Syntrophomonas sp.]